MAFHDTRLPVQVEKGASGGPMFKTTIMALSSGYEKRNIEWERVRGAWDVGYGIQTKEDFDDVIAFFYARQGRAHSFRFKDWADYQITAQTMITTDTSTNSFYMFKRYTDGGTNYDRYITKPRATGWTVTQAGSPIAGSVTYNVGTAGSSDVDINTLTGQVIIGATIAATSGDAIAMTGEFDVPVRFDTDKLDVTLETFDAGAIPSLPLMEVRGE